MLPRACLGCGKPVTGRQRCRSGRRRAALSRRRKREGLAMHEGRMRDPVKVLAKDLGLVVEDST